MAQNTSELAPRQPTEFDPDKLPPFTWLKGKEPTAAEVVRYITLYGEQHPKVTDWVASKFGLKRD